jgi:FkbM family methyltransferase
VLKLLRRAVLTHRGWRYASRVDPDEIRWMRSALEPGDVAIDVGAYKGGYTWWMRHLVGDAGRVLAIEPQPTMAGYLRRCVDDFAWTNVRVEEVAVSSAPGRGQLKLPGRDPSPAASLVGASLPPGGQRYDVRADTLDRLVDAWTPGAVVRLLKCDVEGGELDVFRGAERTLERSRPLLLFECEARHLTDHGMRDVFAHLEGIGYRGTFFWRGERLGVEAFHVPTHQVEGRKPYANNFIFVPEGTEAAR